MIQRGHNVRLGALFWRYSQSYRGAIIGGPREGEKEGQDRFTVAVAAFQNTSNQAELDSLGLGLQSMVTTDLAHVDVVDVVERARLNENCRTKARQEQDDG